MAHCRSPSGLPPSACICSAWAAALAKRTAAAASFRGTSGAPRNRAEKGGQRGIGRQPTPYQRTSAAARRQDGVGARGLGERWGPPRAGAKTWEQLLCCSPRRKRGRPLSGAIKASADGRGTRDLIRACAWIGLGASHAVARKSLELWRLAGAGIPHRVEGDSVRPTHHEQVQGLECSGRLYDRQTFFRKFLFLLKLQ
jgi:hypothetical protein